MIGMLLVTVLLVAIATLVAILVTLRSSRRAEELGEDRYELLRDQQEYLELLREERRMLIDKLGHARPGSVQDPERAQEVSLQAQRQVEQELPRLEQELEQERHGHSEARRRVEQLEREHEERLTKVRQEAERLGQERQQIAEELERERGGRLGAQQQAEGQERERLRLERELRQLEEKQERERPVVKDQAGQLEGLRPWRRRPILVVASLFGALIVWFVSLIVAISVLYP
jgi:chromosome segregation ATPase